MGDSLELLSLARGTRFHPLDHHALKDPHYRKLDQSICGDARPVPLFLHTQLVSQTAISTNILFKYRVYRYQTEGFYCWTQLLSGTLQTILYADFLYQFYKSVKDGKPVRYELPV